MDNLIINSIEELKENFPYATVRAGTYKPERIDIFFGSSSMSNLEFPLPDYAIRFLEQENMKASARAKFTSVYPNLYPSIVLQDKCFIVTALWVNRNGRDAESIPMDDNLMTDEFLKRMDSEAAKAKQKNWFFCTGCSKAKPYSEYAYFCFSGNYCKICKEKNPELYRKAQAETYN